MIKENFIKLCHRKGVLPTDACKEIGIAPSTLSGYTEFSKPRKSTILKMMDYFGCSESDLLGTTPKTVSHKGVKIPVLGRVAAGIPIEAITDIEDYEEISDAIAVGGDYIALTIHGDSMEPRMVEGDVVIVRLQQTIESGELAVVMINGQDATCKKIKKTAAGLVLISLNPAYDPMVFSPEECETLPVRILGKVVELRAKFK